jgi:hypothetical protein
MAVDLHIGTVETTLAAADPDAIRTPQFMAAIVAMVKQELARDQELQQRRTADATPARNRRGW